MALGDDVVNAILNPQTADIERLRRRLNKIDGDSLVLGDMITDAGGLNVPSITAQTGEFTQIPLHALYIRRDAAQSIPNNTVTAVEWDTVVYSSGSLFKQDAANPTRILISPAVAGRVAMITGRFVFDTDTDGYRRIGVKFSNEAQSRSAYQDNGVDAIGNAGAIAMPMYYTSDNFPEYFEIYITHTAGAALDLVDMGLCVFLVV